MLRVRALSISLGVWRLSGGQKIWHRLRICWKHCGPSPHQRWELQLFQSKKEVMALLCFRGRWCSHRFVCQIITRIIKRIWIRLILHVWTRFCGTKLFWLPDQMPRHIPQLWGVEVGVADSEGKFAYNPVSFQQLFESHWNQTALSTTLPSTRFTLLLTSLLQSTSCIESKTGRTVNLEVQSPV